MLLIFRPMRTNVAVLTAFAGFLATVPASAADRLVDACQVAVDVHAEHVELQFPEAKRKGSRVELTVAFESDGNVYGGVALCEFRETAPDEPPSLASLSAMGRTSPAMFLVSHHAVWEHFAGGQQAAALPQPTEEDEKSHPGPRRLIAAR